MSRWIGIMAVAMLGAACNGKGNTVNLDDNPAADNDGDGFPQSEDCDDQDDSVYPGADEICDGLDNDCDGLVDINVIDGSTYYADTDSDTFGDPASSIEACDLLDGYVVNADDCDDTNTAIHPDASEVCDGVDNDCDTLIDDADDSVDLSTATDHWFDEDGDGYGVGDAVLSCTPPEGYAPADGDCDDLVPEINPGATEVCNGIDDDCDALIDDADDSLDLATQSTWYLDVDGDGFGSDLAVVQACDQPDRYTDNELDCDDDNGAIHPDADELCDEVDNNCDGVTDEDSAIDATTWFVDGDDDGYGDGDTSTTVVQCYQPEGYADNGDDCEDADGDVNPGATEYCDGADSDCDGIENTDIATHEDSAGTLTDLTPSLTGTSAGAVELTVSTAGTVTFCDGTFYVGLDIDVAGDLTITSLNGSGSTTLHGTSAYGVVHSGDDGTSSYPQSHTLTISDITLDSMYGADGAVVSEYGDLSISDSIIEAPSADNTASVGSQYGTVTLSSTDIDDSASAWAAVGSKYGSIVADTVELTDASGYGFRTDDDSYSGGSISLTDVTIDDVSHDGVRATNGDVDFDNVEVWDCGGHGLRVDYGTGTVADSLFDGNGSSSTYGGGAYVSYGTLDISDSEFDGNTGYIGGGVYSSDGTVTLDTVTFTSNTAYSGGGVYIEDGSLDISSCDFDSNSATSGDGGGFSTESADTTVDASTFNANTASDDGGAFTSYYADMTITDSTFTSNTANTSSSGGFGGVGYLYGYNVTLEVSIDGSTFTSNEAYNGGVFGSPYGVDLTLADSVLSGNTATYGGAIYTRDHDITCTSSDSADSHGIYDNDASYGGGVYLYDSTWWGYAPTFSGTDCDMGTSAGSDDNDPNDVEWRSGNEYTSYGDNADPSCSGGSCS